MKKLIPFLIILLINFTVNAQLAVTNTFPYNSPTYLVNNVLQGSGITTSNITYTGDTNQIGYFSNGLAGATNPLGLNNGIVLSTGNVNNIPNGNNLSTTYNTPGNPDLLTIAQTVRPAINSTHDAAFIEFDFIPSGDSTEFRFVFASDEYLTWINTNYNDVFAFLLSGPGFSGPYTAPVNFPNGAENLALVPGTSTPITISTIYTSFSASPTSMNGQYYINNPSENTFAFNGYTTVLSVKFPTTCNALYHFKFALGDCQDGTTDTGVFIEGSSFSSSGSINHRFSTAVGGGNSTIVEDCQNATLNFTRPDTATNHTINYTIGGTAINGIDYVHIEDSINFLAGSNTYSLDIIPLTDGLSEGLETLTISVTSTTSCGNIINNTKTLNIEDATITTLAPFTSDTLCISSNPITLPNAAPLGGNFTGTGIIGNTFDPTIAGLGTHQIIYSYTDNYLCTSVDSTAITVSNLITPIISPITSTLDTFICINGTTSLSTTVSGSAPPFSLIWDNGLIGNGPHQVSPTNNTTSYSVYAQDSLGCISDTSQINIHLLPAISINQISLTDSSICEGTTTTILVDATGGGTGLIYTWYDDNNSIIGATDTGIFNVSPTIDGEVFSVVVSDSCTTPILIDSISVGVDTCTNINEVSTDFGVNIYPNPSNGNFNVDIAKTLNETILLKIIDVRSKVIFESTLKNQNSNIDISNYGSGIYYLQFILKDKIIVKRIFKE